MARNYDQIRVASPFSTLTGAETITLNQSGVTKGGFLSVIREWLQNTINLNMSRIEATPFFRGLADLDDADELKTLVLPEVASQSTLDTGTSTTPVLVTPLRLATMVDNRTAPKTVLVVTNTYTINAAALNRTIVCNRSSAFGVSLPLIAGVLTSDKFSMINRGAGKVTVTPTTVTFLTKAGAASTIELDQNKSIDAQYIGSNIWYIWEN